MYRTFAPVTRTNNCQILNVKLEQYANFSVKVQLHCNAYSVVMHALSPDVIAIFLVLYSSLPFVKSKSKVKFYCYVLNPAMLF